MIRRCLTLTLGAALACGCVHPAGPCAEGFNTDLASRPLDISSAPTSLPASPQNAQSTPVKPPPGPAPDSTPAPGLSKTAIILVKDEQPAKPTPPANKLDVPPELPGSSATLPQLPPFGPASPGPREEAIRKLCPPLPEAGPDPQPQPGPSGQPMTLAELQQMALANSPQIRQAVTDVEAARGLAIQAGLAPNPTAGYEGDTMGTAGLAGYQGGFVEQTIKTAGKLTYARAAAAADVRIAELDLKKARAELASRVRGGYFA